MPAVQGQRSKEGSKEESQEHSLAVKVKLIAASFIGNMLELYDFTLFAVFAVLISPVFFPSKDPAVSLLLTVAVFGIGGVARPLGAILIGRYADRAGRRAALSFTILLMAAATGLVGLVPSYDSIGIAAPVLVILLRLVQGFAAGGELGGAVTFLAEHAPARSRAYYISWVNAGSISAGLLSALIGLTLSRLLDPAAMHAWGWRLPFLIGALLGPVGFYIRSQLPETPAFEKSREDGPPRQAARGDGFAANLRLVILVALAIVPTTAFTYVMLNYMPTYANRELGLPLDQAFGSALIGSAVVLVAMPLFGLLADKVGRKPLMYVAGLAMAAGIIPAFQFLQSQKSFAALVIVQMLVAVIGSLYASPSTALGSELFPTRIRSTAVSIAYTSSIVLFGTFAPFTVTWLIYVTGNSLAPGYYVAGCAVLGLLALRPLPDRTGQPLELTQDALVAVPATPALEPRQA
ncbi:MFS transporter, MHS family, proline/betaine transporter [Rhizobiales bacterium GAS188]|nr:MFS transporter, MHS family, proline/betaine transporter [Rhizobiales bacterium GAS188]